VSNALREAKRLWLVEDRPVVSWRTEVPRVLTERGRAALGAMPEDWAFLFGPEWRDVVRCDADRAMEILAIEMEKEKPV